MGSETINQFEYKILFMISDNYHNYAFTNLFAKSGLNVLVCISVWLTQQNHDIVVNFR